MNNLYITALISPTQIESDKLHQSICDLENACRCEHYDGSGKLIQCRKATENGYMDILPYGKVIVITG